MSLLDKMKNTGNGADSNRQEARDSVYEAVHLDAPGADTTIIPSALPDSQLSPGGDSTLASTVYSTMEPLQVKIGDRTLSWQKLYAGLAVAGLVGTLVMVVLNTWLASRSKRVSFVSAMELSRFPRWYPHKPGQDPVGRHARTSAAGVVAAQGRVRSPAPG